MGHRAVAVDLPGFGKSVPKTLSEEPSDFLLNIIRALEIGDALVIISPSMSGYFSLPFLVAHPKKVKGYIPISPVLTKKYADAFPLIKVSLVILVTLLGEQSRCFVDVCILG